MGHGTIKLHDGETLELRTLWHDGPVLLVLLRHSGCPICRQHLIVTEGILDERGKVAYRYHQKDSADMPDDEAVLGAVRALPAWPACRYRSTLTTTAEKRGCNGKV